MSESGLQGVSNPSEMFLGEQHSNSDYLAGLAVAVIMDGSRSFLIEIQVITKQAGLKLQENGIFLNVVSGFSLTETAGDLAIAAAICSSFLEFPIPNGIAFIAEIDLSGELRMVPQLEKRVNTLAKLGYKKCIVPKLAENSFPDAQIQEVSVTAPNLTSDVRGYPLPRPELICQVAKILQSKSSASTPDPFLDLSEFLQTINVTPTPSEVSEILKSLKSPTLALEFFHFCPSHIPNFRHDAFTYNRILSILSKSSLPDGIDKMNEIINLMEKLGAVGNISTVNILIGAFDGVDGLHKCLDLLKKWGLNLTCYTYKCLLQAYLRANDLHRALKVYGEMQRKGYNLDSFGYNMLLHALAKYEQIDRAYKVFDEMKKKHCEPDEYTYTILIRMFGRLGKPNEAVALFEEMLSKGSKPNSMTYNTMIEALVRARRPDKTMIVFSKMVENNCRPNEFTYKLILNGLAAGGQLGRLDEVVKISNKYMNKSIYAYLVRTLSKLGHASEAHRLFCNMWRFHDKGDRDAYLSMLESLCSAGKVTEAIDMLGRTHEKGIITDTFMYNTVLSALGKSKQIPHILDLYEKMKRDGPTPDIFTYNILISSFGRAGQVEEAVRIFEELESSDCKPDVVSYNSLINCLGKHGNLDEAHMRFKEMQEKGLNPDVVTFSTLIECFGKTDKVEMAHSLFNEMLDEGCSPNLVTFNILLDCLEKSGRSAEAVDLYSRLKEQGLTPDSITYAILERFSPNSQPETSGPEITFVAQLPVQLREVFDLSHRHRRFTTACNSSRRRRPRKKRLAVADWLRRLLK
ncbi:pentatricopeptide repeat-containing protein at1g51965 mitochondrial [Phtheirospermum japonicum]|uniref:Pentatricopeptide repeat-containing protein at1g51965 mitochondrial n=1 Tax=Phtheirospermum japonicum TaxID=374723 RepID=A0A830BJ23_9LAMI|nr:pentatricopeptide repeat-containing protein at1g51965 mitochondrial [Phtheirospermum japonicum]